MVLNYTENNDVEQPMSDAGDLYIGDEASDMGPSPGDIEAVHGRDVSKNSKILFGLGIFIILLASIPLTLFGLNNFKISNGSSSSASSVVILNDVCLEAITLENTGASYEATTIGAKHDDDGDIEKCGVDVGVGPTVWFAVTGTGGPLKMIKHEQAAFANQMSVYQGHCGDLKCVTGDNLKGTVLWNTQQGQTYFIRVGGVNAASGNFNLVLQDLSENTAEVTVNDKCQTSIGVSTDGSIVPGSTTSATFSMEGAGSCYRTMHAGKGVWYDVIGTGESLVATTESSDTQLAVFSGSCGSLECITASELATGVASYVQWQTQLAERYYILAHGVGGGKGSSFELSVGTNSPDENYVINDFCKTAIGPVASDGSLQHGSTQFATEDRDGAGSCYPEALKGDGVWYSVQGTGDSLKVYPSVDSEIEPLVSVFEGSCRKLKCVDGTRHEIDEEERKVLKWRSTQDVMYYFLVRGVDNAKGNFDVVVESFYEPPLTDGTTDSPGASNAVSNEPPSNDLCDTATQVTELGYAVSSSTESATKYLDGIAACHSSTQSSAGPGVWFRVEGTGNFMIARTSAGSELDAFISVYSGDCEELVCVADTDGDSRTKRSYTWHSASGIVYYLLVQGRFDQTGQFDLIVEEPEGAITVPTNVPDAVIAPNDKCDGAVGPIPTNGTVFGGSNRHGTVDAEGEGSCYGNNVTGIGVWYKVIGTGGTLEILSKGLAGFTFSVSLFGGYDCENLSCIKSDYVPANKAGVLAWSSVLNVPYYVMVHGVGDAEGLFELMVLPTRAEGEAPGLHTSPPDNGGSVQIEIITENDTCEKAVGPISSVDARVAASTSSANVWEYLEAGACSTPGAAGAWYTVQGADAVIKATITDSSADKTVDISVFTGDCHFLTCVESTANLNTSAATKSVLWSAPSDQLYYIYVHSPIGSTGSFDLQLAHVENENDRCEKAVGPLPSAETQVSATTSSAHVWSYLQAGMCSTPGAAGTWYTVQGSGTLIKATVQDSSDGNTTDISIFTGGCHFLTCLESEASRGRSTKSVWWESSRDQLYYIFVHSPIGLTGPFELTLEHIEAPSNNECTADLPALVPSDTFVEGSTEGASSDPARGNCHQMSNGPGVWYRIVGTGSAMSLVTNNTQGIVLISVFSGGCDELSCLNGISSFMPNRGPYSWVTEAGASYFLHVQTFLGPPTFQFRLEEHDETDAPSVAPTAEPTSAPTVQPTAAATDPAPENDVCDNAIGPLQSGSRQNGRFDHATAASVGTCGTARNSNPGLWFTVNGTGAGIRLSTCKSFVAGSQEVNSGHVSVSVFRQSCGDLQCHVGSNNTCSGSGTINWNTEKDELYHVLITGDPADQEPYVLLHDDTDWFARNCKGESTEFVEQLHILKQIFDLTGNTKRSGPLLDNKGWLSGCDVCNKWGGLECNQDSEVTRIHLSGQTPPLRGRLPLSMRSLQRLTVLDMSDNEINGTIPDFRDVESLQSINLRGNNFTGHIHEWISNLRSLVHLDLNSNSFSGQIPQGISELKSLQIVALANNSIGGTIPSGISELDELEILQLHLNNFTGQVPSELGQMTQLVNLELHGNNLSGSIPDEICQLRTNGALASLTADCGGSSPKISCPSDCCTACL
ncbi:Leucine-rich repeat receptor-like protein kinase [Seminavis robusta]|uniref:Leucine-rich repeat receptor-like protein kinase n=1 Tax=Seminavis robusta TaxID=568900 RepID=A0A9N8E2V1_9STRA|nr:Leucine-rich repeat receptor-like protein kinase [Seminavis robusta]|eukprot:Sro599_g173220.1 Leucine-rich repeat receptor-like protein kinase (1621) ;mRNA; f:22071-27644